MSTTEPKAGLRPPVEPAKSTSRGLATGVRVEISGLSRTYHKGARPVEVLRDVSVSLQPGERLSIIGPSGSGKSTFLHAVGLLDRVSVPRFRIQLRGMWMLQAVGLAARSEPPPTPRASGELRGLIRMDGRNVSDLSDHERARIRNRRIGFVFQAHNLLPEHTALGNVMIPVRLAGGSAEVARQRAEALLVAVGLQERLDHKPGELSGGEQQRVALARALVMGPGLVLADEPTGNLDPQTALGVFDVLLELNIQLGSTLVVVTHSRELASRFPRRLSLDAGQFREW